MRDALLRIREVARKEARQLLRDPRTRMMIFVSPVLQLLLFGYAVNTDVRRLPIFVIDRDNTEQSRFLVDAFVASDHFRVVGRSDRSADLGHALDRGSVELGIEIPAGFARDAASSRGARIQILLDGSNSNTATIAQGYANRITQRVSAEMLRERTGLAGEVPLDLRARAWYNPELVSRIYNVPAVIGALLMMMCLLLTAMAIVREREVGTLEQLMVSPIGAGELILGKTLPVLAVALIDLVLISTVAVFWFEVPFRGSPITLLSGALIFIIAGLATGLLISSVSRTQQEAFMAMFLVFLPVLILSGLLLPVENMPLFFQYITELNPLRHFLVIVRTVFLKGEGVATLWREYLTLAALAIVILGAALRRLGTALR
jgi:ABC-2 type transport system permease protein